MMFWSHHTNRKNFAQTVWYKGRRSPETINRDSDSLTNIHSPVIHAEPMVECPMSNSAVRGNATAIPNSVNKGTLNHLDAIADVDEAEKKTREKIAGKNAVRKKMITDKMEKKAAKVQENLINAEKKLAKQMAAKKEKKMELSAIVKVEKERLEKVEQDIKALSTAIEKRKGQNEDPDREKVEINTDFHISKFVLKKERLSEKLLQLRTQREKSKKMIKKYNTKIRYDLQVLEDHTCKKTKPREHRPIPSCFFSDSASPIKKDRSEIYRMHNLNVTNGNSSSVPMSIPFQEQSIEIPYTQITNFYGITKPSDTQSTVATLGDSEWDLGEEHKNELNDLKEKCTDVIEKQYQLENCLISNTTERFNSVMQENHATSINQVIDSRNPGTVGLEKDEKLITQEGACVENIRETGKIDKERKVQKKMLIQEKLVNSEKKLAEQIETKKEKKLQYHAMIENQKNRLEKLEHEIKKLSKVIERKQDKIEKMEADKERRMNDSLMWKFNTKFHIAKSKLRRERLLSHLRSRKAQKRRINKLIKKYNTKIDYDLQVFVEDNSTNENTIPHYSKPIPSCFFSDAAKERKHKQTTTTTEDWKIEDLEEDITIGLESFNLSGDKAPYNNLAHHNRLGEDTK